MNGLRDYTAKKGSHLRPSRLQHYGKRQCVRQISWHVPDVTPTPHQKRPRPINNHFGRGHSYCLRMRRHWWRVHWTSHEFLAPMSIHGHFELNMPRLTVVPTF